MRPQVVDLFRRQLEGEVLGEAVGVALKRLVENFGRDAVETGEVGIEDDAVAADREDAGGEGVGGRGHVGQRRDWLRTAAALARTAEN